MGAFLYLTAVVVMVAEFMVQSVSSHTVISYPGSRGDNLAVTTEFPWGMQRNYPCGGIPTTTNRTNWPLTGGAIAFQPGWFAGHARALIYINIGFGTLGPGGDPVDFSTPLTAPFEIQGPYPLQDVYSSDWDRPYPGTVCLPQLVVPEYVRSGVGKDEWRVGGKATVQVVEVMRHGGALYNCVDITFSNLADAPTVNKTNCFNSSNIKIVGNPFRNTTSLFDFDGASTVTVGGNDATKTNATACPVCTCPSATPSSCPKTNGGLGGMSGGLEGLGLGFSMGVAAMGVLGA